MSRKAGTLQIPEPLPALWVQLGRPQRALTLARSVADPWRQAEALAAVAEELAEAGQLEEAERVAGTITDPDWQG